MANDLQQTRYDQLVRRVGGIIGPGSKVAEALPELFPMLDVENVPIELLALSGTRIAEGFVNQAATPALKNIALLRNPGSSGILIRLEALILFSDVAELVVMGPTQNSGTAVGTDTLLDLRLFPTAPAGQVQRNQSLGVGSQFSRIRLNGTDSIVYAPPGGIAVLSPGTAYEVSNSTVNTLQEVTFRWVERVALESELNLT